MNEHFSQEELRRRATAIKAKCWECCGYELPPADCGVSDCPLYQLRPLGRRRPLTLDQRKTRAEAAPKTWPGSTAARRETNGGE